jgi:pyruvate dehydrogenase E1 component alpha subunit
LKTAIKGFLHLSLGQEAVAAGICTALKSKDMITTTHRGHGHAIAKGIPFNLLMAELYAKSTGCCKGRGGSMHLTSVKHGVIGSNAIVGANIPLAAGAALAAKQQKTGQVIACFFGDGAVNTGAFHEGINIASLWKLPVVYVCANNKYAISTHVTRSTPIRDLADRAVSYGIPGVIVDGMDPEAVYVKAKKAINRARDGDGPTLIECKTYRMTGSFIGDAGEYRPKGEYERWEPKDPIKRWENLVDEGILTKKDLTRCRESSANCLASTSGSIIPNNGS